MRRSWRGGPRCLCRTRADAAHGDGASARAPPPPRPAGGTSIRIHLPARRGRRRHCLSLLSFRAYGVSCRARAERVALRKHPSLTRRTFPIRPSTFRIHPLRTRTAFLVPPCSGTDTGTSALTGGMLAPPPDGFAAHRKTKRGQFAGITGVPPIVRVAD